MARRRLLILGGTSGIGAEYFRYAISSKDFVEVLAPTQEIVDVLEPAPLNNFVTRYGPTDVLYSVGVNELDWIEDATEEAFDLLMKTNVWGFLNTIKALRQEEWPSNVVAVTSDAAWRPMRTSAIYCASKAALEMAVRVASRELAPKGWRVNAVAPGKVADTPMTRYVDARVQELRGWSKEQAEEIEKASSPLGRPVTRWEVAEVIHRVLMGPDAQTGEIIAVNGGR